MLLVLVGRDEDDLQLVLVLGRLLEAAVELAQAAAELPAGAVQAAAEEQPDQGQLGAQGLHVHLGFGAVDEPLPEQTEQKLRHRGATESPAFPQVTKPELPSLRPSVRPPAAEPPV